MAVQQVLLATVIAAAVGGGSAATMNPSDMHSNLALSGGNLTVSKTAGSGAWHSVRSQNSHSDGFYYVEVKDNTLSIGQIMGFMFGSASLAQFPGQNVDAVGWYYTNTPRQMIYNSGNVASGGAGAAAGHYAGLAIRINSTTGAVRVWGRTDNVVGWLGGGNPSTDSSPTYSFSITAGSSLYFAVALYNVGDVADVNLGSSTFNMAIPAGAQPWIDTTGFAPSYADPYWPNTVLLIRGEGTHGSTSFTDAAGLHSIAATGGIAISTADGDFPLGAIDTDGSGSDYLTVSDNPIDWAFGTGAFTVETRFKLDAAASGDGAYFLSNYYGSGSGWAFHIMPGSGSIRFLLGGTSVSRTFAFSTGVVYHVEASRDFNGHFRIFVNGAQVGSTDTTTLNGVTVGDAAYNLVMGCEGPPYTTFGQWDGRQNWARITKGVARHRWDFTPESTPYAMGGSISYDTEVTTWAAGIVAAGATPTDQEKAWAHHLIRQLQGSVFGTKVKYMLPFLGTKIAAHRMPLRDSAAKGITVNNGSASFADADCSNSGGLNNVAGASKALDTLTNPHTLGSGNAGGLGIWMKSYTPSSNTEVCGCYDSGGQRWVVDLRSSFESFRFSDVSTAVPQTAVAGGAGHYYGQAKTTTDRLLAKNGPVVATSTTSKSLDTCNKTVRVGGIVDHVGNLPCVSIIINCFYMTDGTLSSADIAGLHNLIQDFLIIPTGR